MDIYMLVLRLIHIFAGTFWVGTSFFFVLFFEPTVKMAGREGGIVMGRLTMTRFPIIMALSAFLTVAAGFLMYLDDSGGFQLSWITTPTGIVLAIGSIAGLFAFALGLIVQGPASAQMGALQKEIQAASQPPQPSQLEELRALQERIARASRWGVVLMVIAVLGMAVARELV